MGKSSPKLWATFVFFIKLTKENNRPLGENSPNPVTLVPKFEKSLRNLGEFLCQNGEKWLLRVDVEALNVERQYD
jgi:hypothetical protein